MAFKIKILISLFVFISALLGSLYFKILNPYWNPFLTADEILTLSNLKMSELKTLSSAILFSFNYQGKDFKMKGEIEGVSDADLKNEKVPKSSGNWKITFNIPLSQFQKETPPGEINILGEFEVKTFGGITYLKIKTIPFGPFLSPYFKFLGIDIEKFQNRWIKIDLEALASFLGIEFKPKTSFFDFSKYLEFFKGKEFIKVEEVLKSEKIDDISCHHYLLGLTPEGREAFLKLYKEFYKISPEKEFPKEKREFLENLIKNFKVEVFIGKKDRYQRLLKFEKEFPLSKFSQKEKGKISFQSKIKYFNFNRFIEIVEPKEFLKAEEILKEFMEKTPFLLFPSSTSTQIFKTPPLPKTR